MTVRCKLFITNIQQYNEPKGTGSVTMAAVFKSTPGVDGNSCAENSEVFGKYTPSANLTMSIQNPSAFSEFKRCLDNQVPFYVDFTPEDQAGN